jgi:hypothetical protein
MPATDMAGGKGCKKHWSDVGYRAASSSLWRLAALAKSI